MSDRDATTTMSNLVDAGDDDVQIDKIRVTKKLRSPMTAMFTMPMVVI